MYHEILIMVVCVGMSLGSYICERENFWPLFSQIVFTYNVMAMFHLPERVIFFQNVTVRHISEVFVTFHQIYSPISFLGFMVC